MERYLRPLAIVVVVIQVCTAFLTIPALFAYLYFVYVVRALSVNSLITQAIAITGMLLTFVLGVLALIVAAQRGHRSWSIAFAILLALFAYSPLLLSWVLQSSTPIYDASKFYINTTAITFIQLSNLILPAIILAVVVFIYSLRYRRVNAQGQEAGAL